MTNDEITNLNEAPASVTYSITSKGGFNALFTIRSTSGKDLLETMDSIEKVLVTKEYKPQLKQTFGAKKEVEYVEGKKCPKCGGRLVKKISSANKPFHKCENGKWDFATKQATGCDFVDWLNPVVNYDKTDPYKDPSKIKTVEAYEENQDYQG
jgi:hypothetical protein